MDAIYIYTLCTKSTAWFNFEKLLDLRGQLCGSRAYVGPPAGTKRWWALGSDFFWTSSHHLISSHDIPMISTFLKVSSHSIFIFETLNPIKNPISPSPNPLIFDFEVMPWCLRPWRPCHPCRFWPWPCPMGSRHQADGCGGLCGSTNLYLEKSGIRLVKIFF